MGQLRVIHTHQVNGVTAGFTGALTLKRFFHDRSRCALDGIGYLRINHYTKAPAIPYL
ncbi:hypothetical protein OKW35_002758 [Paraburkholderia sp. MM5477-R1]